MRVCVTPAPDEKATVDAANDCEANDRAIFIGASGRCSGSQGLGVLAWSQRFGGG